MGMFLIDEIAPSLTYILLFYSAIRDSTVKVYGIKAGRGFCELTSASCELRAARKKKIKIIIIIIIIGKRIGPAFS